MRRKVLNRCLVFMVFTLLSVSNMVYANGTKADDTPLKVATSFSILGDWVRIIGGPQVTVTSLVKVDEDVHMYNGTPKDMAALAQANVLVVNGLGLEGWMERLVNSSGFDGSILTASHGVDVIRQDVGEHHDGHGHEHDHHKHEGHDDPYGGLQGVDPHAWTSLKQARVYIENIKNMLVRERSAHTAEFESRAKDYLYQLDELDNLAAKRLSAIPESQRIIVIPHNSFAYLARDYLLSVHSLSGLNTEAETSASNLAAVVRSVRDKHIKAIFSENVSNTRMIEQIQNETKVKVYGTLISGALSSDLAPDYLSMMRYNLDLLTKALAP